MKNKAVKQQLVEFICSQREREIREKAYEECPEVEKQDCSSSCYKKQECTSKRAIRLFAQMMASLN